MMFSVISLVLYLMMIAVFFFVIAFAVKYGILWAVRALSEDQLAKIGRGFNRK